jgi:hypothetical protein
MSDPKHPTLPTSSASGFALGDLEEQAEDEGFEPGARAVVVAAYPTPIEAQLAKSRLSAEGIPADLVDVHTVSIGGPLSLAVGGVKVRVLEDDVALAREVIAGIGAVALDAAPEDDEEALAREEQDRSSDALASRALRAGIVGAVMFPPLSLYSAWLVWRAIAADGPLTRAARLKAAAALAFDGLASLWLLPFL